MTNQLTAADVRRWREAARLSQDEFADLVGVTRPTIARWEGGDPTPSWLGPMYRFWQAANSDSGTLEGMIRKIIREETPRYAVISTEDKPERWRLEALGFHAAADNRDRGFVLMRRDINSKLYSPVAYQPPAKFEVGQAYRSNSDPRFFCEVVETTDGGILATLRERSEDGTDFGTTRQKVSDFVKNWTLVKKP